MHCSPRQGEWSYSDLIRLLPAIHCLDSVTRKMVPIWLGCSSWNSPRSSLYSKQFNLFPSLCSRFTHGAPKNPRNIEHPKLEGTRGSLCPTPDPAQENPKNPTMCLRVLLKYSLCSLRLWPLLWGASSMPRHKGHWMGKGKETFPDIQHEPSPDTTSHHPLGPIAVHASLQHGSKTTQLWNCCPLQLPHERPWLLQLLLPLPTKPSTAVQVVWQDH